MSKRDLKADSELCEKYKDNIGPWLSKDGFPTKHLVGAAAFLNQAREGWPHAIERAVRAETLLRDSLPMAMWESCMYKNEPEANPTTHCCDWNEVVERIREVLGDEA